MIVNPVLFGGKGAGSGTGGAETIGTCTLYEDRKSTRLNSSHD